MRITLSRQNGQVVSKDFRVKGIVKSKIDEISSRVFVIDRELKSMLPLLMQGMGRALAWAKAESALDRVGLWR